MNSPIDISKDTLLGIDEICRKLSISRSTLERLRGNTGPRVLGMMAGRSTGTKRIAYASDSDDEAAFKTPFPEPSCMIGRSPRWTVTAINKWLKSETDRK